MENSPLDSRCGSCNEPGMEEGKECPRCGAFYTKPILETENRKIILVPDGQPDEYYELVFSRLAKDGWKTTGGYCPSCEPGKTWMYFGRISKE